MKYLLTVFLVVSTLMGRAQEAAQDEGVEMADEFFGEGKIYVVITVMSVLLLGLGVYLLLQDRKVTRLEKKVNQAIEASEKAAR